MGGTLYFMAPEIIRNMEAPVAYGRQSDIWFVFLIIKIDIKVFAGLWHAL